MLFASLFGTQLQPNTHHPILTTGDHPQAVGAVRLPIGISGGFGLRAFGLPILGLRLFPAWLSADWVSTGVINAAAVGGFRLFADPSDAGYNNKIGQSRSRERFRST